MINLIQGTETLQVKRKLYTGTDKYGQPTYNNLVLTVNECLVELGGSEIAQQLFRDVAEISVIVYLPHGTEINENDTFTLRGKNYTLAEEPKIWKPFRGSFIQPRVIIGLVRYNG